MKYRNKKIKFIFLFICLLILLILAAVNCNLFPVPPGLEDKFQQIAANSNISGSNTNSNANSNENGNNNSSFGIFGIAVFGTDIMAP